jgi:hypothetical protein
MCRTCAGLHDHCYGGLHQEHGGGRLPARLAGRTEVLRLAALPGQPQSFSPRSVLWIRVY